ncbi:type VI secretion system Vgr family protein [Pseudoduganella sp. R-34]|uniref:type VI secretion system Vgr family protein n=1 Tax=unclassified Pseudoduganella TaxID=2637179 RepID=UPI003CE78F4A
MSKFIQSFRELISTPQHNRILRLAFPHKDGPAAQLLVNRLDADEGLSRDFEFTVELLSGSATLELKQLQGKLLCIELVRGDGTLRYFTGYCFAFRLKRTDGAVAFYEAQLGPWLKYLSLRKNSYLFHNKNLHGQTETILGSYGALPDWDWRVAGMDPQMTDACQFAESDHNYLSRRWEAAGLLYWYEHSSTGHKLILTDDSTAAAPIDGSGSAPFQRHGGATEEDGIGEWSPTRQVMPGSVRLSQYDFKNPLQSPQMQSTAPTLNKQGSVLDIESYEYTGAYGFKDQDGDGLATLRMQEMEALGKHFDGAGNNRFMMPGRAFHLTGHFDDTADFGNATSNQNEFLVLQVRHIATNNYLQEPEYAVEYANSLSCIRKMIPWRPGRSFNSIDTKIFAPQTATVVGPNGNDSIHVDEFGRVRVQFHWDRIGQHDDRSSAWIRVVNPWAGSQLGSPATPRVGSEVVVQWLDGSPDRPIIMGAVSNQDNMPAWKLPEQQALTGMRSRELAPGGGNQAGGRSNHLILDDTNQNIQAQLKSDHQHSQLSLGKITRIEDNAGRKDTRGEGFELATGAWGVIRAGLGMLVSTEARERARGTVKDMGESARRLDVASENHAALADLAQQAGAQEAQQQAIVAAGIQQQNDAIRGGSGPFPELSKPLLVLASPAGIATTTAQSTHIASDQDTALTTGKNLSLASGGSLFASVKQTFRLFVENLGMKLLAYSGDIDIQALKHNIHMLAKLDISMTANRITISAKEELKIIGGGSYSIYKAGGIEHGTNGDFVAHAAKHSLVGPQNATPPTLVDKDLKPTPEQLHYTIRSRAGGRPFANVPYELYKGDAKVEDGLSDEFGRIVIDHEPGTPQYKVKLPTGEEFVVAVREQLAQAGDAAHAEQTLSNRGSRALDGEAQSRTYV